MFKLKIIFQSLPEWFDWISLIVVPIVVAIITTIVNVKSVNHNTNMQLANQNKETYRPRLKLQKIINTNHDLFLANYMFFYNEYNMSDSYDIYSKVFLENIGNGIANDITFYSLNRGEIISKGMSCERDVNQESFSTEEIAKNKVGDFLFSFSFNNDDIKKMQPTDELPCLILCNYKDLNNNNYKLIIGYLFKKKRQNENTILGEIVENSCYYDIYYYQEGSYFYNEMLKKYNDDFNKICRIIDEHSNK